MIDQNLQPAEYVLGFAFNPHDYSVLLVVKNRPAWQVGLFNGIGGKVDPDDKTLEDAMVREFKEEAGIDTIKSDWKYFGEHAETGKFSISLFCAFLTDEQIAQTCSPTDEKVYWIGMDHLAKIRGYGVRGLLMYLAAAEYHMSQQDSTIRIGNLI